MPKNQIAKEEKIRVAATADTILESLGDSLVICDLKGNVIRINNAFLRMMKDRGFEIKEEEIIGKNIYEVVRPMMRPEDIKRALGLTPKLIKEGSIKPIEMMGLTKDGKKVWVSFAISILKDLRGNPSMSCTVIRDISELKKAEEGLKESEEHTRVFAAYQHAISELRKFYAVDVPFEQMVQKTLDLIIKEFGYYMAWYAELIEEEKVIIPKLWAGKYEKYLEGLRLEYESDKRDAKCAMSIAILTKKPFGYADLEHDKDFEKWRAFALQYGYRSNQAIPLVINGKCKSAFLIYSTRPRAFSQDLIRYLEGLVNELVTITEKIAEFKRVEEKERQTALTAATEKVKRTLAEKMTGQLRKEVKQKTSEIKEAYQTQERFMADASHELRTPLAVLRLNLDFLKSLKDLKKYPRRKDFEEILESSKKQIALLTSIIEELTLLSGGKGIKGSVEKVRLETVIRKAKEELGTLAEAKNINYKIKILNRNLEITGNRELLKRMVKNLVSNAIKYNKKEGEIKIILRKQKRGVELQISDTGKGIPPKELPHIFERFYRIEKGRPKEKGGVGLGLAICKWIAELHGGTIGVKSRYGKGSTFKVFLPFGGGGGVKTDFFDKIKLR